MKQTAALFLFACVVATPAAASETWNVVEGPLGAQKGSWNVMIEGADLAGQATMSGAHGAPITYSVTGKIEKGVYSLKRQTPSDHVDCVYRGEMKGDGSIAGSSMCAGVHGPWIARPAKK